LAEKPAAAKYPVHADSLAKLIIDFYGSRMFTDRKPSTRQLYRYALDPGFQTVRPAPAWPT
jgi:hypothetical protein